MYKKFIIIFFILISPLFAKQCYWTKDKTQICYKTFYSYSKLKEIKRGVKYFIRDNKVYYFQNKIKVNLKYSGAILTLLDDFDLDFLDKRIDQTYIFRIKDMDDLFSIITNLNAQSYVKQAKPIPKRVYRKGEKQEQYDSYKSYKQKQNLKSEKKGDFQWKK